MTGILQFLLLTCGFVLVVVGLARSYLLARQAVAFMLLGGGDRADVIVQPLLRGLDLA